MNFTAQSLLTIYTTHDMYVIFCHSKKWISTKWNDRQIRL